MVPEGPLVMVVSGGSVSPDSKTDRFTEIVCGELLAAGSVIVMVPG